MREWYARTSQCRARARRPDLFGFDRLAGEAWNHRPPHSGGPTEAITPAEGSLCGGRHQAGRYVWD